MIHFTNDPARIYFRIIDGRQIDFRIQTIFYVNIVDWKEKNDKPKRNNSDYAFNIVQSPLRLVVLFSSYVSVQEIVLFYFTKKNF